ncbi:uncharacterized protein LOC128676333 isoform X1 [Plodia interpunctella]|uniref:uncharacterized protein LOC128676333 isoform X1 n=1 Tax=Plodia interpunctella TaxID=58824 RepID=UPI002367E716|nr:uncharacterized protein LOC128676333 isoform X1 [Plodia interpunctella]
MFFKGDIIKVLIFIKYIITNANSANIEDVYIPEVVQSGATDVVLGCQYSAHDNHSVQWIFNNNSIPKQWAVSIRNSDVPNSLGRLASIKQSLLSFPRMTPEMSGNYTCEVHSGRAVVQQTKSLSVFSPENDFALEINHLNKLTVDIKCTAWGLYPRPELTLEIDNRSVSKQVQRVWWTESAFAAEGTASLRGLTAGTHQLTCRLYLPLADYTAIMKKYINLDNEICCSSHSYISSSTILICTIFIFLASR